MRVRLLLLLGVCSDGSTHDVNVAARIRDTIDNYDYDTVHTVGKQMAAGGELFTYALAPLGLLLWWGDLTYAKRGFAKVLDVHKRMLARVQQGEVNVRSHPSARRPIHPISRPGVSGRSRCAPT